MVATIAPELATGTVVVADDEASLSLDVVTIDASLLENENDGTIVAGPSFIVRRIGDWSIRSNVATSTVVNASIREVFAVLEYDATGDAFSNLDSVLDSSINGRRKLQDEGVSVRRTFSTSDTSTFGPISVENSESLGLYLRVRMKWNEDGDDDDTSIILDTMATYVRELSLTFESGTGRETSTSMTLWEGIKFPVPLPPPLRVIVDLSVQPEITLEAEASITLETTATMSVTATGSAKTTATYENRDWDASGSLSMNFEKEADLRGEAEAAASISVSLGFEVEMFRFVELEVAIEPSLEWNAEASIEPLVSDDIRLDTFDLIAKVTMPVTAEIDLPVLGEFEFDVGSIFDAEYTIITLPTLSLKPCPLDCSADGTPTINFEVTVDGDVIEPQEWEFISSFTDTDWSITSNDLEAQLVYNAEADPPLQTPRGTVLFRTTPVVPQLPGSLIADTELTASRIFECCTAADCGENEDLYICENAVCLQQGNPRFTLLWSGDDDLDIHVITPAGFEIFYATVADGTGGQLDKDDIPEFTSFWVENIFWPDDGNAPLGRYSYFVHNFNQVDSADSWTLRAYRGDELVAEHSGVLAGGTFSPRYVLDTTEDTSA